MPASIPANRPCRNRRPAVFLDPSKLEVGYFKGGGPGKFRCWKMPAPEARDIVRWSECGSQPKSGRAARTERRFGSVLGLFVIPLLAITMAVSVVRHVKRAA